MNIGLTGGIASGKSTVSRLLVERGALLVDADRIAREIVLPGSPALDQIADRFGADMLLPDGSLDRKRLGNVVFSDAAKRKALEEITHPAIRQEMMTQMRRLEEEHPQSLVVVDVPLLYESGLTDRFEEIVVVYVPRAIQLERLMRRDGLTEAEASERLLSQWDIEKKRERADYVIDNSKGMEETRQQVEQFWLQKGLL
ncbi:dephospho-CoA kinase [Paenibacillus thiaminolyticus]|uniref:Dephospho-CoA kinase n=1 Tax=Paenibacillus thiaminolyticus TaxID=49283 RepID=A0AAP9DST8_PANTH|nr:dephospho-CoA kinase [Paenibacillus thiaminolyticus]MCY9533490.1 dephospho-CoA kinase [Paenibacillus thiaminolyticus]MCY9604155.1 dephospho-CoA kinase [Paenibacillus thiaminolyticus]MCY9606297.1 dephospho-CoA kinase [Paenibacillus thiaminolyticus]MCY9612047.1 dephospho-CoA kinase [Paenibacillus thiaminolyticus]MCY9618068.1 dephospho-CoA kinase [Paenibacillus thiaminolyticus]